MEAAPPMGHRCFGRRYEEAGPFCQQGVAQKRRVAAQVIVPARETARPDASTNAPNPV